MHIATTSWAHRSAASGVRAGYAPFMLLGINGLAVAVVATEGSHLWLGALGLLAVGCSFAAERLIPYQPLWNRSQKDVGRDIAHALVNKGAALASVALLPWLTGRVALVPFWPVEWAFVLQVLLAVLVFDCGVTLTHRASHRFAWLWRFHAVHHSVTRLYGFNGLMKHPVHQALEMLAGIMPLLLLGMPPQVATALGFVTLVQLLMQHSNVDYRAGLLGSVLALNSAHRLHHRKGGVNGDVNFGLFTTLWDRALGTCQLAEKAKLVSDDLGLDARSDYPIAYLDQLAEPLRARPTDEHDGVQSPTTVTSS